MDYPNDFPHDSRARVDAAKAKAERNFVKAEQCLGPSLSRSKYQAAVEKLVKEYITSVFFVYADEVVQIGKGGIWPASCLQPQVEEFGANLIFAAQGKCYDRDGIALDRKYPWDFTSEIRREIRCSERWLAFLDRVTEVAEAQAAAASSNFPSSENVADERAVAWEDIKIEFLSDERIQVSAPNIAKTLNYAEFGFEDGRNEKPNQAWITLRSLAEQGGILRRPTIEGQKWSDIEKRVQEIRRVFRTHFGVAGDPLPFVKHIGYQAQFKIGCSQSYKT